jgi:DNA-binding response OmpR family regulator
MPSPELFMSFNSLQGCSLLIVEDDPDLGALIVAVLASEGAAVTGPWDSASGAHGSVEERRPDAALLDVNLRDGDSYALAAELEAQGVPYAFLSSSDPADVPRTLRPFAFLSKPASIASLVSVAVSLIGARSICT